MNRLPSLTPRQTRTALDLLTGAVVISVAFALAGLTWRIAGHAGTGAITVPSGKSAPSADAGPALGLFGQSQTSEATAPTSLPLELKGIVAANPASLSSAFIVVSGGPVASFTVGQNVGGATIQGIARDRVILNNAGRIEYLTFPAPTPTSTPGAAPAAAGPNAPPPAAAPVVPSPGAPPTQGTGPDLSSLLQRFNATQADGGYRIGANAPGGLAAGDVLLSINGTPLSDQTAATAAYQGALSSGSATILILRGGKRLTLTIPIR
ncbi:type II secretion system protein N [Sphingomonas sp.]|uniref:type II secretion system protein N n=1 Tax=Sphingomonas sp. TaxID=28214 RepID=UPI001B1070F9|nr:type II secretion system protein N [Sphingomonas sp.]MBO9714896.1 signaling protein [Sphingomonas sp.]